MAVSIGKRKRKTIEDDGRGSGDEDDDAMRALFQKAFEAKFKPLERKQPIVNEDEELNDEEGDSEDEEISGWSGLSEDSDDKEIETFHHDSSALDQAQLDAHDRKSFMSSRPPTSAQQPSTSKTQSTNTQQKDDPTEVTNLKHDLALQRLLKESHLLDPESFQSGSGVSISTTSGKTRLKALDLRLQDLGAKHSPAQQQRMPLAHRKGIAAKAAGREKQRRKDAAENGVILEKARSAGVGAGAAKGPIKRRERGIGAPTVGKFKGGTLRLSERDVRAIQGRKKAKAGGRR